MRKKLIPLFTASLLLGFASCSKTVNLTSDNFTVTPKPLETVGGVVPATINGSFPEKYMKKNEVVTIVPELRYGNGQVKQGQSATFQGEKVMGNDQVISYRMGGHYTMKTSFDYVPDMQKSDMYVVVNKTKGNKLTKSQAIKVNYGVIATSQLYKRTMLNDGGCIAPDSFQRVKQQKQEANIKFLINQANLRKSELKNNSVQEFVRMLREINRDQERLNMRNVEVQAYASPEGGYEFNDKLANKREEVSEKYVKQQLKNVGMKTGIDAHYTAQDWDGFQRLVQASDIQDKDVILRVLSMYKDPEEREQQIRNMSEAFRELADGILPELRRSRLIINYETIGRSDDEIMEQYKQDATKLSPEELLYAATLEDNNAQKEDIYKTAAKYYDKDYRAYNNLGVLAFNNGDDATARNYFERSLRINPQAAEPNANLGLLELKKGNLDSAEEYISKAVDGNDLGQALGNLNIAKGNYAQAEENFKDINNNSAALAQLLNKDYAGAKATLNNVKHPDAMTSYLHAVTSARQGNSYAANSYLKEAIQKDPSLQAYSDNDLEFAKVKSSR